MKQIMLNDALREKLQAAVSGAVIFDEPLSRYTSFGVGGKADAIIFPKKKEELTRALAFLEEKAVPFMPVGNGTNLIVRDGGYRGVVISFKELNNLRMGEGSGDTIYVHAEAGTPLAHVVGLLLKEGITGMEFCAGIPGSVGGAIRMNAGAYGLEIKDVVDKVIFMTGKGELLEISRRDLDFTYRRLALPPDCLIVAATFSLLKGNKEDIGKKIEKILALRKERHPLIYPNAGSIFKNPPGLSAGRIIDEMGLKGLQIGDARISEMHGNFIVNLGRAKAKDVLALIDIVKKRVFEERGIVLETEVCIIGEEA
jgi:UDP-N-acetylmuramate dehydrogenase